MNQATMSEVRELIAFYDKRDWNWLLAAEFILGGKSNHWTNHYILIPKHKIKP